jgi:hypothetical protein
LLGQARALAARQAQHLGEEVFGDHDFQFITTGNAGLGGSTC